MPPLTKPPIKLKVWYQELSTESVSVTAIFMKKSAIIEVPYCANPMSTWLKNAHHEGFAFIETGKPTLYHNILHIKTV